MPCSLSLRMSACRSALRHGGHHNVISWHGDSLQQQMQRVGDGVRARTATCATCGRCAGVAARAAGAPHAGWLTLEPGRRAAATAESAEEGQWSGEPAAVHRLAVQLGEQQGHWRGVAGARLRRGYSDGPDTLLVYHC